ncbi:hypothetical protein CSOJ01_14285 [Colletotrichum sojae]|uniref:Uncharacterized protein n=1 Tax=Colletotrichum sojae TaxID=2175907 RepID=A0A8H6MJH8_9PEZI|nr:hypothetical protein CSOJ01_14285 [Colletotrichum sojae]
MGNMSGTGVVHDELGADAKLFGVAARERGAIGLKKQRGGLWLDARNEDGDVVFEERRATMLWSMPWRCETTSAASGDPSAKSGRRRWTDSVGFNAGSCEAHGGAPEESLPFSPTERQYDVSATEEHDDVNSHLNMLAPSRVGSAVTMPAAATTIAVTPLSDVDTRRKTGCEEADGGRDAPISNSQGGFSATASFWCGPAVFAEEKAEG